jgi:hypothetical protein
MKREILMLRLKNGSAQDDRAVNGLIGFFAADYAFVDGLTAGESFFGAMPVGDGSFAHLPAEKDYAAFHLARKIQQSGIDIFDLNADGVDFRQCIFGALLGFGALGFAAGNGDDIDASATVEKNAVSESLHFGFELFHHFLAGDGGAQQGFKHRQQRMGFIESESSIGHAG